MGVSGLWKLVEPCGKPVPVETLEGKILAVDISIWLYQFVKGYQDSKGSLLPQAHLLGLFHRLCKLLYYRVRPVFVFDGCVPQLKRDTITKRQQLRSKLNIETDRIQSLLLQSLAKEKVVQHALGSHAQHLMKSPIERQHVMIYNKNETDAIYKLPNIPIGCEDEKECGNLNEDNKSLLLESPSTTEESSFDDSNPFREYSASLQAIDVRSAHFKNLPAEVRHEILVDLKETRKQSSWGRLHELPSCRNDFSTFQMKRLLKRRAVQESIEETEREIGGKALTYIDLHNLFTEEGILDSATMNQKILPVCSDEALRFTLVRDLKNKERSIKKTKQFSLETDINKKKIMSHNIDSTEKNLKECFTSFEKVTAFSMEEIDANVYSKGDNEYEPSEKLILGQQQRNQIQNEVAGPCRSYMIEYGGMNCEEIKNMMYNGKLGLSSQALELSATNIKVNHLRDILPGKHLNQIEHLDTEKTAGQNGAVRQDTNLRISDDSGTDSDLEEVVDIHESLAKVEPFNKLKNITRTENLISTVGDIFSDVLESSKKESVFCGDKDTLSQTLIENAESSNSNSTKKKCECLSYIKQPDRLIGEAMIKTKANRDDLKDNAMIISSILNDIKKQVDDIKNIGLGEINTTKSGETIEIYDSDDHKPDAVIASNKTRILRTPPKMKAINNYFERKYAVKRTPEGNQNQEDQQSPGIKSPYFKKKLKGKESYKQSSAGKINKASCGRQKLSNASKMLFEESQISNSREGSGQLQSEPYSYINNFMSNMSAKIFASDSACTSAACSSTASAGSTTPARRLRTRTSTGGNVSGSDSGKKGNYCGADRHNVMESTKNNVSATNSTVTSSSHITQGDEKQNANGTSIKNMSMGANKKYHNSCPHPTNDRGRGKPLPHLQPHSSSTFNLNKTEEFHFDTPVECPVFRPTQDEFRNPLAYISKIRPIAEKCGIAKILPPECWSPPFAVDVDKLKFTPRVQRLNELEAKTRVKLNFLDQIAKFWELQGSSLKIPMVERKALDLYTLHRIVQEEGGMEQTTKERKWAKVANRMSYPSSKSVGATLKAHYERILHPFEVYTSGKVLGAGTPGSTAVDNVKLEDGTDYKAHEIPTRQQIAPPSENARRSKRFANSSTNCGLGSASRHNMKIEGKEDFKRDLLHCFNASCTSTSVIGVRGQSSGTVESNLPNRKKTSNPQIVDPLMKYICHICNRGDVEESMLLCDGCDDSYHTFCLLPPLSSIPKGEWLCPRCVVEEVSKPTEAFGFEQAEREYTLQQFGQMADQFKMDYFRKPVHLVPTHLVEREFWRIVSSIDEDVTVEYGADLHTMDHGSGFPTKSSLYLLPGDQEYAESSWNLNNLPLLEDSILGHINADISGMNAPWMYVGMCFSAFCWHNEDHWSYSINYLHWGEPKTWYGVPGFWAEQFEETMKQAAPELFASQPDLLHQLVTIMNPNILMNNGVPVYRTDQNAGEFVITFPRAYHAGFNQGYNFAEAVNFAPADWLKMGRECVNHYSMLRRFCVFSHDELVCKMALEPAKLTFGIATACYIDMAEMVDSEKKLRKSLLEWGVTRADRKAFELVPDDERHCQECNTTCFLSAVSCECTKSVVCLRHYTVLCGCVPEKHTLLYRYTLDEMPLMLQKLKAKAQSFERWLSRCRDIVDANTPTSVPLAELQELCKEAEVKKFPSSLLIDRLNSAIVEAEKCVTVIQQLGINKVRTRSDNNHEAAQYKLTMEELELFVQEIDNLCCIIEEGSSVRELLVLGKQFLENANVLLNRSIDSVEEQEVEKLLSEGNSLRIELPLINQLNIRQKQLKWYKSSIRTRNACTKLTYGDIKSLLCRAASEIDPNDAIIDIEMRKLQEIGAAIEAWEKQAAYYFRRTTQQHELADIEQFLKTASEIEGQLPSYITLKDALRKAKDWLHSVEQLQTNDHFPYCHTLEAIVQKGKNIPIQLEELKLMQGHLNSALEWKDNTARVFLKKATFFTLLEVLMPRSEPVVIDSDSKIPFEDGFVKEMNPAQIVDSFKKAEEKELRDMRELRCQNMSKNPLKDVYCICKLPFQGVMYNCQLCRDWFHENCLPQIVIPSLTSGNSFISRQKWLCPSCVRSKRPRLEIILPLLVSLQRLPIRLPEDEALRCLAERAMNWQDRVRKVLTSPDITVALETILMHKRKQKREGASVAALLDESKLRKQQRRRNNPIRKSTALTLDKSNSSDEDDEDGRLHIVEDALSNEEEDTPLSTPLQKVLPESEKESLNDLMMEGDLLEVSLDESNELWRILSVIQPICSSEAAAFQKQHQSQQKQYSQAISNTNSAAEDSNDSLLVQSSPNSNSGSNIGRNTNTAYKKRRLVDPINSSSQLPRKKTTTPNKPYSSSTKKPTRKSTADLNSRQLHLEDSSDSKQPNGCSIGTSIILSGQKKRKRISSSVNSSGNIVGQKKHSQRSETAEQEDDEEECRAENCHKPTGREVDWVQCDGGCNEWFHMFCVGLNRSQIKADDDYFCLRCSRTMAMTAAAPEAGDKSSISSSELSSASTKSSITSTNGNTDKVMESVESTVSHQTVNNTASVSKGRSHVTR